MGATDKLFRYKDIYDTEGSSGLFVSAMAENAAFQYANCPDYKRIADEFGFDPQSIKTEADIKDIPFIPTLYFKHHELKSVPDKKMVVKATSSGTSGSMSRIGFDLKTLLRALKMSLKVGRYHHLISFRRTNYMIFGFRPSEENKTAASKTAYAFTLLAPARKRVYALEKVGSDYELQRDTIKEAFKAFEKSRSPMRTIGFPAYTYFILKELKEEGKSFKMPKGSMIALAGGWKHFWTERVDKYEFYRLAEEILGIKEDHIVEFFGAVEHPILYTDCKCHRFHIPCYGRVIIRDPETLKPVPDGQIGIVNLLTPMIRSAPLLSTVTDDLGVIRTDECPCGAKSPSLEILGRVGVGDIVTCAAGAEKYLKEQE